MEFRNEDGATFPHDVGDVVGGLGLAGRANRINIENGAAANGLLATVFSKHEAIPR